jgi:chemotaxis protein histidine kinase CheA
MSRVTERIGAHPAYAQLVGARRRLAEVAPPSDSDSFQSYERIRQVLERVESLINEADPALVSPDLLQLMAPIMAELATAVEQYAQTPDAPQLASAEAKLDALIAVIGWPIAYAFKKPSGMGQAVASYRDAVQTYLGRLRKQGDQLAAQLASLQAEAEQATATVASAATDGVAEANAVAAAAEARLTAASSDADTTLAAAITAAETQANALVATAEEHLTTLAAAVEAHKARLDTLTASYSDVYTAEQKVRDANAAAALTDEAARNEVARAAAAAAAQTALAGWTADAQATLDKLAAWEADAERRGKDMLGALAGRAMAAGYGKYADDERRTANWLRRGAVAAGAVAILWSVGVAAFALSSAFEWTLLLRFLAAVPMLAIALYLGEQSGKHRDTERQARRSELELAALDPYLASLDPVKRGEVKEKLADRMFAQPQVPTEAPSDVIGRLFDLLEKLIKKQ